jgi:cytosine permease
MLVQIVSGSNIPLSEILSFPVQFPPDALTRMGIATPADKVVFCINLTIGQAAALSLLDADLGRFARSSRDIGIVAVIGNVIMNGVLVAIGGIIMFAGMPKLAAYYMQTSGMTSEAARQVALESADHVAIAFIVFGGAIGTGLMVLAQLKAQVVNTYSGSLSLANLFDVSIGWRPGRALFVIAINVVSFFFLFGDALTLFKDFLNLLGVVTTCLITIMLADYYGAQRLPPPFRCRPVTESVNVSGVAASIIGVAASFVDVPLIHAVPFVGTVIATAITYTAVRGFQGYVTFQKQARAAVETLPIA